MSCCCVNILNLCNKPVCGLLTLDQVAGAGTYTLLLDFLETTIVIEQLQVAGEDIFFPVSKLNENYQYTGQIFDGDGNLVTIEDSPNSWDCIKFKTVMKMNVDLTSSEETPPVLDIPGTVVIEDVIDEPPVVTGTTEIVTGLTDGSTTVVCDAFIGVRVIVIRGNIPIPGIDPLDGSNYFTKLLANNFITFSQPLVHGEFIRIQTIPQ